MWLENWKTIVSYWECNFWGPMLNFERLNWWFGARWFGIWIGFSQVTIPFVRGSQESKPPTQTTNLLFFDSSSTNEITNIRISEASINITCCSGKKTRLFFVEPNKYWWLVSMCFLGTKGPSNRFQSFVFRRCRWVVTNEAKHTQTTCTLNQGGWLSLTCSLEILLMVQKSHSQPPGMYPPEV